MKSLCQDSVRRPLCGLTLAAALVASTAGCDSTTATPGGGHGDDLVVRRGTLEPVILLTGELASIRAERILVPQIRSGGRIPIRWIEADGSRVEAGQKVLELDSTQFSGELDEKRIEASRAQNELMRKRADVALDLDDKRFQVDRTAVELEKAELDAAIPVELRSRREHQEAQLAAERARTEHDKAVEDLEATSRAAEAELEELRLRLEQARNEIRSAEEAIRKLTLTAPRAGILVVHENPMEGRKLQNGDSVWVGLAVMSIPDLSSMKVEARLSDVDDGLIEAGMKAVCTLDTYPDRRFSGVVREIAPVAKEEGNESLRRAFKVDVVLDEVDPERMRPGMSAKVEVLPRAGGAAEALLVPRAALDFSGERPRALLADGSTAELVLGACDARRCEVTEGLAEGARLRRRS